ncbi:MAG: hypothetical protein Q4D71_11960 [Oscillospiraceae bacterium]|nr:hypothetical protein [Oscillospiraceae bacterium]
MIHSEKINAGEKTDYLLKGLLTHPDNPSGPVSTAVIVHGSATRNIDEKVMKLTPLKDRVESLAGSGIASLRFYNHTFTHRCKLFRWKNVTVKEETIDNALLAGKMLKNDPMIGNSQLPFSAISWALCLRPGLRCKDRMYRDLS